MKIAKVLLVLMLIGTASNLFAQEQGSIRGKVIDRTTKQPLVGANVVITGTMCGAMTDMEGRYFIEGVEEEVHKLKVSYIGYHSFIKTDVRVIRNKTTYVEEIELTETALEGQTITVTAGAFQENEEAPVSNYSYSREEIRRSPGAAGDIFRAIGTLPGVSSSGGEFSAFSVRGGSPQENIILVDHIPFGKVTHLEGGPEEEAAQGGKFSVFSPGIIEKADFQAGGFPVRYGGKNASVISLSIKEGNRDDVTLDGYIDLLGWEVNYNGPTHIFDRTSLILSARHQDFKKVLEMTGQKDQGHPRFSDLIFKTTTELNATHKMSLLGIYSPEKYERTIDHVYESEDFHKTNLPSLEETKGLLGLNWRVLTGEASFLQNTFYYTESDRKIEQGRAYTDPVNGELPTKDEVRVRSDIFIENQDEVHCGIKSEWTYITESHSTFFSGMELQRFDFDYGLTLSGSDTAYVFDKDDYRPDPEQKFVVRRPEFVNTSYDKRMFELSAYTQYSMLLGNKLTLTPGLRVDYHQYNEQTYFSPRLSAQYRINSKTSLNAAGGVYYQKPEPKAIALNWDNHQLNDEKAYHYILGFSRYLKDDLKWNVETYYKSFDDLIVRSDRTSKYSENSGDGWAGGIDFSLIKRFVDQFYGQINYSYSQSERNDRNGGGFYHSDFNKPHIFSILGGYELNKEWTFAAKWQYASGRPKDAYVIHPDVHHDPDYLRYSKEITANNADRLPASHSLNIRVDYRKQFRPFAVIAYLDILNVYGHLNVTEERFQERDGGIDEQGFEMMPTFGIKLEL